MSDFAILFLILGVVYISDCVVKARKGAIGLVSFFGGRFRIAHPEDVSITAGSGLLFANPIPGAGTILVCESWPISVSPTGVFSYVARAVRPALRPPQIERFVAFDSVRDVRADSQDVFVNGSLFVHTSSPVTAARLASFVLELARIAPDLREAAIDAALDAAFDKTAVTERVDALARRIRGLHVFSALLFLQIFVAAPILVWVARSPIALIAFAAALVATMTGLVMEFVAAHRTLYPESRAERRRHAILLAITPLSAIRACDALSRDAIAGSDPAVAIAALCGREAFARFARCAWLDFQHPMRPVCPSDDPAARATEEWMRRRAGHRLERLLENEGLDVPAIDSAPTPDDDRSLSYCPRCETQYTIPGGECESCGGLALRPLRAADGS